ncbi:hypothetical protein PR003_g31657 [Phytophthora rubi]|uniref:Uncharacterized protein n=2 Tax=Phytophthora TaxID=4783 RepID=A0A6A3GFV4_9STRA|nr:hypothetical protein PR002_g31477 [Phytophthora rubi]KAE8959780.1 hypothetical protein PR001_g30599 [Phytophthora rubi]KAE9265709.1 hypothetical protein PF008_g31797 [Phytophthora fragariae]KAE9267794.1 hypothetical protein PR003_g31657 [Phytophthora rubi]
MWIVIVVLMIINGRTGELNQLSCFPDYHIQKGAILALTPRITNSFVARSMPSETPMLRTGNLTQNEKR